METQMDKAKRYYNQLKLLNFISFKFFIFLLCGMFFAGFNTYAAAIPLPGFVEDFCKGQNWGFCSGDPAPEEQAKEAPKKKRTFTESEQQILTRLLEKEKKLKAKDNFLNRRESQLKALEEDLQSQIAQLEQLQQQVEKDIERKKVQDREQLNKAVEFYAKMEPAKAAASIAQLNVKTAVQMLLKIKEKQASDILAEMDPAQSAKLIEEIARKK